MSISNGRGLDVGGSGIRGPAGALVGLPHAWITCREAVSRVVRLDLRLDEPVSMELRLPARVWPLPDPARAGSMVMGRCLGLCDLGPDGVSRAFAAPLAATICEAPFR